MKKLQFMLFGSIKCIIMGDLLGMYPRASTLSLSPPLSPTQKRSDEVNLQTALENLEMLEDILKVHASTINY